MISTTNQQDDDLDLRCLDDLIAELASLRPMSEEGDPTEEQVAAVLDTLEGLEQDRGGLVTPGSTPIPALPLARPIITEKDLAALDAPDNPEEIAALEAKARGWRRCAGNLSKSPRPSFEPPGR